MTGQFQAIIDAQVGGGIAAVIGRNEFDTAGAMEAGVDLETLLVAHPNTIEEAATIAEMLVKSESVDVIIVNRGEYGKDGN